MKSTSVGKEHFAHEHQTEPSVARGGAGARKAAVGVEERVDWLSVGDPGGRWEGTREARNGMENGLP